MHVGGEGPYGPVHQSTPGVRGSLKVIESRYSVTQTVSMLNRQISLEANAAFGSSRDFTSQKQYQKHRSSRQRIRKGMNIRASFDPMNGNDNLPFTTAGTPAGESKKVQDYLRSPFDLAAFGPRLAVGAALSAQTFVSNLQADIEKASTVIQGPRSASEKQELLQKELEARLTEYLQKGASLEAEFLTAFADLLPTDVRQNLPPQLKDVLFRGTVDKQVPPTPPTRQEVEAVPIATVERNQTAAELEDLRNMVTSLRVAMSDLTSNTDPAEKGVLEVNVTDARASLSRALQRMSPSLNTSTDIPVSSAKVEAQMLLREAEALKF